MGELEGFHTTWEVWVGTFLSVVGIVLIDVRGRFHSFSWRGFPDLERSDRI